MLWLGALSCEGINVLDPLNPHPEPKIDPAGNYQIIGFVIVDLYDVDINGAPPGPNSPFGGSDPWYFQVDGNLTSCNLVRGRIACDTDFVPVSSDYLDPQVVLVK